MAIIAGFEVEQTSGPERPRTPSPCSIGHNATPQGADRAIHLNPAFIFAGWTLP